MLFFLFFAQDDFFEQKVCYLYTVLKFILFQFVIFVAGNHPLDILETDMSAFHEAFFFFSSQYLINDQLD